MEARLVEKIPEGGEWQYEPKWDGFRCLAFRDGEKIELQSKSGQPLARYFPEIVAAFRNLKAKKFVLDGELVIPTRTGLSFDDLLLRLHPAESRIKKLSASSPALFIIFDLLVDEKGKPLLESPLSARRRFLEKFTAKFLPGNSSLRLSPMTLDLKTAQKWFQHKGSSLDGVMAKKTALPYQSGLRTGMDKVKRIRTADCVIGGFRYAEKEPVVGSFLLGLYDEAGLLHHVGFTSSFKKSERAALTAKLKPLIKPPGFTGQAPGGPSRWSTRRSAEWEPLAPRLVVEVAYDHVSGGRFRHGTRLLRWRPDKSPGQCTLDQIHRAQTDLLQMLESAKS